MRTFLFIICLVFVILFQVAFLPHFTLHQAIPNLLLVVMISWCVLRDYKQAFTWAIFGGLFLDLYSGTLFGLSALSLVCLVLITYFITQHFINKDDLLSRLGVVILATIGYEFLFLGFTKLAQLVKLPSYALSLDNLLSYFFLWQIVVNIITLIVVYYIVKASHDFLMRYEEKAKAKV